MDQIEIACAPADYDTLIWEKALRFGWPVTLGAGLPIECTRTGRALLSFCEWVESDFLASQLRALLESGDIRFRAIEDLNAGQAARLLVKSKAGWGRATYERSLGQLEKGYQRASRNKDLSVEVRDSCAKKAVRAGKLLQWISGLLQAIPQPNAGGSVRLSEAIDAALAFLESSAATPSALDNLASSVLSDSVAELRSLGEFTCPLPTALRFIRERAEGRTVGADRPRPGHLHVSSLRQSGYAGRPFLFVVGVEEGRVFPSAVEDPILLNAERRRISPSLQCSTDKVDESVFSALSRLATCGSRQAPVPSPQSPSPRPAPVPSPESPVPSTITLSYSCRDLREDRETFPSWLVLQAYRVQQEDASLSYPDLAKALGTPVSIVPAGPNAALADAGWWVSQLKSSGVAGVEPVLAHFAGLARGVHAEEQRASEEFSEFDGHVPEAGAVLDPCKVERPVADASVVWREPASTRARLILIENGEIVRSTDIDSDATPPVPIGHGRSVLARREVFTVAHFDRLRVLTTELKRLVAAGAPVALRCGVAPALADSRLASALWWV